jgi:hypothetical protein
MFDLALAPSGSIMCIAGEMKIRSLTAAITHLELTRMAVHTITMLASAAVSVDFEQPCSVYLVTIITVLIFSSRPEFLNASLNKS